MKKQSGAEIGTVKDLLSLLTQQTLHGVVHVARTLLELDKFQLKAVEAVPRLARRRQSRVGRDEQRPGPGPGASLVAGLKLKVSDPVIVVELKAALGTGVDVGRCLVDEHRGAGCVCGGGAISNNVHGAEQSPTITNPVPGGLAQIHTGAIQSGGKARQRCLQRCLGGGGGGLGI